MPKSMTEASADRLRMALGFAPGSEWTSVISEHMAEACKTFEERIAELEFLVEQYRDMIGVAFGDSGAGGKQ